MIDLEDCSSVVWSEGGCFEGSTRSVSVGTKAPSTEAFLLCSLRLEARASGGRSSRRKSLLTEYPFSLRQEDKSSLLSQKLSTLINKGRGRVLFNSDLRPKRNASTILIVLPIRNVDKSSIADLVSSSAVSPYKILYSYVALVPAPSYIWQYKFAGTLDTAYYISLVPRPLPRFQCWSGLGTRLYYWGEPERAPHKRYSCARIVYIYIIYIIIIIIMVRRSREI